MTPRTDIEFQWVDDQVGFDEFLDVASREDTIYLDTEFHREKTYYPQLALIQVQAGDRVFLIDPLATDVGDLAEVFTDSHLVVLHAAQQDLDVLSQSIGAVPERIFDTQIAAAFLGHSQPSLSSLLHTYLAVTVPKTDRLSDWLRRPLTRDQLNYAASDVLHLPALTQKLCDKITELGRGEWVEEACEELRTRPTGPGSTESAWLKVKDVRTLKGRSRWVARRVAMWREERARHLDVPVRHVMSDIAVLGIAQKPPASMDELASIRGVDARLAHGRLGQAILEAVRDGVVDAKAGDLKLPASDTEDVDKSLRSAVTLVSAWIAELARQSFLDVGLLATRKDIVELLSGSSQARLAKGWRSEIVGRDITDLVDGTKALTFTEDTHGRRLRLVDGPFGQ